MKNIERGTNATKIKNKIQNSKIKNKKKTHMVK